jgi:two-component system sensor histidine kinase SenX3
MVPASVALVVALSVIAWLVVDRRHARARLNTALEGVNDEVGEARTRHERLELALGSLAQGAVVFDQTGTIAFSNAAAADFLDARHSEALVEDAISQMSQIAIRGEVSSRELELFGPPRRTLVVHATPLVADGERVGAVVVVDDVSERRRLEAVRRDFIANISHELKTPVGALALLAETLAGEDEPSVAQRLADRMQTEAFRVARTIDDLLELTRIEGGEGRPEQPEPVHLFLTEAADRARPGADARGIEIAVDEPPHRLNVIGDHRQLVSAVYNLLDNAVKFSDAGSTVNVRARADGASVVIAVEDHGIGIPGRDLERVFERFYRVDRARSRETGGTGLGLAIVRHVAVNHHGDVAVESHEGKGSTFTLRLPAGPGPVAAISEAG